MACPPPPLDHGLAILWLSVGLGLGAIALVALGYRRPEKPPDR